MENKLNIQLTAAEMSVLWTQYINDSASVCVVGHFLQKVEDEEVRPVLEFALNGSVKNPAFLNELFQKERFPIPVGFTNEDVYKGAPRLFSDTFSLIYLRNMSILGMVAAAVQLVF